MMFDVLRVRVMSGVEVVSRGCQVITVEETSLNTCPLEFIIMS